MDNGPPEPKRVRMNPEAWSNGHGHAHPDSYHGRALPPPGQYPPQHTYAQPQPPHPHDDHRGHEPDYSTPQQDPHRPQVGHPPPYQTPFSGPGPREPMMKRDPSDDAMHSHAMRPHSTGEVHQEHGLPPPDDHRRQSMAGYESLSVPPNQAFRPAPPYPVVPPPTALYDRPYGDPPPTPGGSRDVVYSGIGYTPGSSSNQRKKAPRTSQACVQCRAAKGKCDDPKPCSSCREKNIKCNWQPPEPKQGDRQLSEISSLLQDVRKTQEIEARRNRSLEKKIGKIQKILSVDRPGLAEELKSEDEVKSEDANDDMSDIYDSAPAPQRSLPPRPSSPTDEGYRNIDYEEVPPSPKVDTDEEEPGKQIVPNEPAIPDGHTTAAAKLLRWPAVDALIGDLVREEKIRDNYPSLREWKHGIRLYGRGPTQAPSPEYTGDDFNMDAYSPSPGPENVYGRLGGSSSPSSFHHHGDGELNGGAGVDDLLDLSPSRVKRLTKSFMENIHIMHPIIHPKTLESLTREMIASLPTETPKPPLPGFVHPAEPPPKKQKRPASNVIDIIEPPRNFQVKPGVLQRSIKNAVVLMVLALGEICDYKQPIPDLVPDSETNFVDSPLRNGWQSPVQASPVMSSSSSGLQSPQEVERNPRIPRRGSVDNQGRYRAARRNMDIIPGMKYVGPATTILGNQNGDNEHVIHHITASVLVSLYYGQLARPVRAHKYITDASQYLQILLKIKPQGLAEIRKDLSYIPEKLADKNNLAFAFWSILQLESDLVAELDVTHSGITTLEQSMPWPNFEVALQTGLFSNRNQLESYAAQLMIRNHLNTIHKVAYSSGKEDMYKLSTYLSQPAGNRDILFREIDSLIDSLPNVSQIAPTFAWTNDDDLPTDILSARLRAKSYGGAVIIYRPYLQMVVNRESRFPSGDGKSPMDRGTEQIPEKAMIYVKSCIKALINSTRVFYNMPSHERLIITNPWGTAHAQFGNVLVLLTTYADPKLKPFIERDTLKTLVNGTLKFLKNVADRDSSLNTDMKILKYAARKLNLLDTPDAQLSSSFSSVTTGPVATDGTPLSHALH